MTVADLIEVLQALPQGLEVIVESASDYILATHATKMAAVDRGGYISHAARYRPKDLLLEQDFILIE